MKSSFLMAGGIMLVLAVVWTYLFVLVVTAAFRKKHFPRESPNPAQALVLAGKTLSGIILITALFAPVRDFLLVVSSLNPWRSGAFLSFLLICCCLTGVAWVIAAVLEGLLSRQVFKGQSLRVELQHGNLAVAVTRVVLLLGFAWVLWFGLGMVLQSFIPTPMIPTIR
ncbi:hypothetical protein [Mucilaginibacter sp. SG564]|uniref:DUF350 domain-containing protein n=1 Tax=Mucilaginibacter sp. SG564 TaxID=2587022 RepID=UPI0015532EFA|nr:hypothetical protein [Mucilaginibacter sp. SG564]NOW98946.1 hypothetical protein [Mucilaginibacter sp. SG564]